MKLSLRLRLFGITLLATTVVGCKYPLHSGHYEGNIFKHYDGRPLTEIVHFDLQYPSPVQAVLVVKDPHENRIGEISIFRVKNHQLKLQMKGIQAGTYLLDKMPRNKRSDAGRCYTDASTHRVQLCYDHDQVSLKILNSQDEPHFTLSGDLFKKDEPTRLETPIGIVLESAIDEAFKGNIDLKIALEHVYQAKNQATGAWLNLLPHITTNLIWHAPLPTYVSTIAVLQGATPFVLPSFYLDALCARYNAKVQKDALMTLQSDLVSNLEQLFYAFHRDTRIAEINQEALELLNQTAARSQSPEFLELKKDLSETLETTLHGLKRVLTEDRYALSQALGKHNPYAISAVSIGNEVVPIEQATPLIASEITETAVHRSFEVRQLDYLTKIAKIKKVELFFYWMDPSADQKMSLGFNLIPQKRIARSQIEELGDKRQLIKNNLYIYADRAVLDYNEALETYQSLKDISPTEQRLAELSNQLASVGTENSPSMQQIKRSVLSLLSDGVLREATLSAFRSARAKIDRILLRGYSERLLPHLHDTEIYH